MVISPTLSKAILMQCLQISLEEVTLSNIFSDPTVAWTSIWKPMTLLAWAVSPALLTHAVTVGDRGKNRTLR